jgi:hypothetical protein
MEKRIIITSSLAQDSGLSSALSDKKIDQGVARKAIRWYA